MLHYADEARGTASRWTNHAVDKARGQIAKALGCQPDEVYFTS